MLGLPRILLVGIISHSAAPAQAPAATVDATFFEQKVRPLTCRAPRFLPLDFRQAR